MAVKIPAAHAAGAVWEVALGRGSWWHL